MNGGLVGRERGLNGWPHVLRPVGAQVHSVSGGELERTRPSSAVGLDLIALLAGCCVLRLVPGGSFLVG
eukprot:10706117-Lingulodinium_polyedra.AAC.1